MQGRKSRYRSLEDIERIVRTNVAKKLSSFFITDDNFSRNKNWEAILDLLIKLREVEKFHLSLTIQVDTLAYNLPNFILKCKRAGVSKVFIGLENINPDSLQGAQKRQNKITYYRQMLLEWKNVGIITYCGYIIGFPKDTPESIVRDIEIIKKELPVDLLEFFYLTPLPGSEDHLRLHKSDISMDDDLNKYDLNHPVTAHPKMSIQEWKQAYHLAWNTYYSASHIETILLRVNVTGGRPLKILKMITLFCGSINIEGVHPLESGVLRKKSRRNRRSNLPLENPFIFYPKFLVETVWKIISWMCLYLKLRSICMKVLKDPKGREYTDKSLEPVQEDEIETREMFKSEAAKEFVKKGRLVQKALS